jgi:hypothetical protein
MNNFSLWVSGSIVLIVSVIVNAVLSTALLPFTGVPNTVMTFRVVGPTGMFTIVGVIGAVIVFALVRRFSKHSTLVFTWIAAIVLLLSFIPDIFVHNLGPMFGQITTAGILLLMLMHVACAAITVCGLVYLTKQRSPQS